MNIELEMPSYEIAQIADLTVALEPVQENDYDSVWPAGGGKNLLPLCNEADTTGITVTRNADGSLTFSGTAESAVSINLLYFDLPAGDYLFSNAGSTVTATGSTAVIYVRDNTNSATIISVRVGNTTNGGSFTLTETTNIRFYVVIQPEATLSGTLYPMIRKSTESDYTYAPYSNICPITGHSEVKVYNGAVYGTADDTYTIDLDGTVYGGTLDVLTGVLTVDRAMVDLGTLNWVYNASGIRFDGTTLTNLSTNKTACICSQYRASNVDGGWINQDKVCCIYSTRNAVFIKDTAYTDAATFKTAMNGVQLVYELATPTTVQLTAQDVETLTGINNVWSDSGDVTVTISGTTQTGDVVTVTALPQHKIQLFMP